MPSRILRLLRRQWHRLTRARRAEPALDQATIRRVDDAAPLVRDLFLRSFGETPPDAPIHYVAQAPAGNASPVTVGYIHVDRRKRYGLLGGLCVDARDRTHGLGRRLIERASADASDIPLFAQMVNPRSIRLATSLGFEPTRFEGLYARWAGDADPEVREELLQKVRQVGPF